MCVLRRDDQPAWGHFGYSLIRHSCLQEHHNALVPPPSFRDANERTVRACLTHSASAVCVSLSLSSLLKLRGHLGWAFIATGTFTRSCDANYLKVSVWGVFFQTRYETGLLKENCLLFCHCGGEVIFVEQFLWCCFWCVCV